ncbi:MAG: NAD(P)H-dependent oxidoreductase [Deltaproteobacteria bacterium]|nr:NAD(P)H-dependent oxidoreductase [Deltaproteobacteria bacterium]MBN2672576.1 NAD(P)H-dependent oxidoreductase [Deltaproteobacteria bacterium]
MESKKAARFSVLVINGSPKGSNSSTMQYVRYISKQLPKHHFETVHVAKNIELLKKDRNEFNSLMQKFQNADAVLFGFGVWVIGVSSQLMSFIETVTHGPYAACLKNKPVAVISTSIHYYDHLAHQYMRAVCEDLHMRFIDGLSLDIADLHNSDIRKIMRQFAQNFADSINNGYESPKQFAELPRSTFTYQSGHITRSIKIGQSNRVLILTDADSHCQNETAMVLRLRSVFKGGTISVYHLSDIPMTQGCRGCMRCGYDYSCVYQDGFTEFYNGTAMEADILIFCGTVRGRYLSPRWKMFFDRAFFWNHTPSLAGKQIGYLISGPLRQNPHLVETLEVTVTARQNANFVGIVTDEDHDSAHLDKLIDDFAHKAATLSSMHFVAPQNFLAVGGQKIFRDEIWGRLRAIWQADYRFYKRHGMFDFPHRKRLFRFAGFLAMLFSHLPFFRKRFYNLLAKSPPMLVRIVDRHP